MLQLQRRTLKSFSSLADLKSHQQTKDFNDQDRFLTMQRKWRQYSEQMKNEKSRMWNGTLNKTQQLKIDLLVSNVSSLGASQYRLFEHLLKEQATKRFDYDGITYSLTPEELAQSESTIFPTSNPKWQLQQEALAKLWPLGQQGIANALSKVGGSGSATTSTSPKVATQAVVEPEKAKVEKSNFDVQLASFDPINKIKIIKEVREILKLGLKEAKDLVESAPCTIQKAASKDDAEKLKDKLEALKCQINLL